jgi:copper chaperone CopZ
MRGYYVLSTLIALACFDSGCHYSVNGFEAGAPPTRNPLQSNSNSPFGWREVTPPSARGETTQQTLFLNGGATGEVEGDASSTLPYYLLWSPNMLSKTVASFAGLMGLRLFFGDQLVAMLDSSGAAAQGSTGVTGVVQKAVGVVVLPLLSSACCGIQLLINAMVGAGGCAGFNKHLGPLRPYFLGTLLGTVVPRMVSGSVTSWTRLSIQLLLAFLPEIVHAWNVSPVHRLFAEKKQKKVSAEGMLMAQAEFSIPGMGCVSCIKKINNSLRKVSSVADSEAWLVDYGGRARVQYAAGSDDDAQDIALKLAEAVRGAGFDPCTIDKVEVKT